MVKRRLLLVDDDAGTVHVMYRMLSPQHELRYALDGAAALALARQWKPDLVLLDAHMPGISGTEVCRQLKADAQLAQVPVVIVSALQPPGVELLALELGAAAFLSKPVDEDSLLRCVREQLALTCETPVVPDLTASTPAVSAAQAAQAAPLAHAAALQPSGAPHAAAEHCLLIVDDDPSAVQAVHAALANLPARFVFAMDGRQALAMARLHRPDIILLDLYMPGLDGLDTLRELKADPALADSQVIIITRYAFPEMEKRALDGGGVDFIAKPYTQAVLQARVANVLRLKRQAEESRAAERQHWQRIGNARLARVVAAASDAIITADAAGQVVLINAAACSLFGVDAAFTIGQPVAALLPGVDLSGDARLRRQRLVLKAPQAASLLNTRAGQQRAAVLQDTPVELSLSRLTEDKDGKEALTTLVLRDLSEQERAESDARARLQAEAALNSKTLMISYLAHEIGNPLNAILGFTELMQADKTAPLPPAQAVRLQLVADAGEHLRAMMRDVLNLQRLEVGSFDMQLTAVLAGHAAERAVKATAAEAASAGMVVQIVDSAPGLTLWADDTRLHQCLVNLLSNAIKYKRDGGGVRLHLRRAPGQGLLEVEDDGPGLSDEQQKHLFEPFNRLGQRGTGGAGIGLALSQLLVHAMHGQLSVVSAPGLGSRFVITLPTV